MTIFKFEITYTAPIIFLMNSSISDAMWVSHLWKRTGRRTWEEGSTEQLLECLGQADAESLSKGGPLGESHIVQEWLGSSTPTMLSISWGPPGGSVAWEALGDPKGQQLVAVSQCAPHSRFLPRGCEYCIFVAASNASPCHGNLGRDHLVYWLRQFGLNFSVVLTSVPSPAYVERALLRAG